MEPLALALFTSVHVGPGFACGRTGAPGEAGSARCWGDGDIAVEDVVDLAIGGGHACALHSDGEVSCWGANGAGQAGVDDRRVVAEPTRLGWLAKEGKATALSAGGRFTCATTKKGTTCWGDLRTRPLPPPEPMGRGGGGIGRIGGRASPPIRVTTLPGPDGLVQHDAGAGFACGVRKKGSVVCWGRIPDDPAGYGFVEQPLSDATQVAVGSAHACALDTAGAVWCWRDNEHGQLGDGRPHDAQGPVQVVGLPRAASITAGSEHTCARTVQGEVWCWGHRRFGAVGDGLDRGAARRPTRVEGVPKAATVTAGVRATCAVPTDPEDHPWCWGGGAYAPRRQGPVVEVPLTGVVAAAASEGHTCARTRDGGLWCWGAAELRGDGLPTDGGVPHRVAVGVKAVASGRGHSCLIDADDAVACWGDAEFGSLDGQRDGLDTPQQVDGPAFVDLAAGDQTTCARTADGTAWCWGDVGEKVGEPDDEAWLRPTPTLLGPGQLLVGAHHTALLHEGAIAAVGQPWDGALGVEREEESLDPVPAPVDGLTAAATRRSETCAIRTDGSLWCWGGWSHDDVGARKLLDEAHAVAVSPYGTGCAVVDAAGHVACWGDLGPPFVEDGEQVEAPMVLEDVDGVTALAMGEDHTCALRTDATLTCWGRWRGGQGYNRPWAARMPTTLPLTDVAQVVAGGNHTCARTTGGEVWCWGAADEGQVGHGSRARQPKPVKLPLEGIEQLAAGSDHTCARSDASTWCWGKNDYGQLGTGTAGTDRQLPTPVPWATNAVAIAAGYTSSCATRSDGTHTCWGRDVYRDRYAFEGEQPFAPPVRGVDRLVLGDPDVSCALGDPVRCWGDVDASGDDPRLHALGIDAVELALGDGHACARTPTGDVRCWGANHSGQAGAEGTDPVDAHTVVSDAVSVGVGQYHSCAAGRDGRVRCWGDNEHGQLGHDGPGGPEPVLVDGVEGAVEVIAGWSHTCARTRDDRLLCWGRDHRGQLGRGAPYANHRPWRLVSPASPRPPAPSR